MDKDGLGAEADLATRDNVLERMRSATDSRAASKIVRDLHASEAQRIAKAEFNDQMSPDQASRQLASLTDDLVEAALRYTTDRLADRRGLPTRADSTHPVVTVIGLGQLGGEEMSYDSPLELVFLFDAIDPRNVWHRNFYETLVTDVVALLGGDPSRSEGLHVDLRGGPKHEVGVPICSLHEAAKIYESSGQLSQRMQFVKARVVAGSADLGTAFLDRLRPWVYHQFQSSDELAELQAMQHNLHRRAEREVVEVNDFISDPGGLIDINQLVVCLQLLFGGHLPAVRQTNLCDAILSLQTEGCLAEQEATGLLRRYARLSRLQHQLAMVTPKLASTGSGVLPSDPAQRQRLAWELGIRVQDKNGNDSESGDVARFEGLLSEMLAENRALIAKVVSDDRIDPSEPADETELLLDVIPDRNALRAMMRRYGMKDPDDALEQIASLSVETVPFLSHQRCRHAMASLAPHLLGEIALTPDPDDTLRRLVRVTDSLGAKATLWDLLKSSKPTLSLMVRLCATTPLLASILIENPGMIDELVDSLLINKLPSSERLDAHSIEICRGSVDVGLVLREFKNSAHLMIGVRDMLGKETMESTQAAIADTAEACLRRMIEHEQETVAQRFGDPMTPSEDDQQLVPAEMIAVGLGKLGGREPNYQSGLDVLMLYSGDGETCRRVGGRRHTTTNDLFFNQVAQQVLERFNETRTGGQLYELTSQLSASNDDDVLSTTFDHFLDRFRNRQAPLEHWLALCKARVISGTKHIRRIYQQKIVDTVAGFDPPAAMAEQVRQMRLQIQNAASSKNLKRGQGGTIDVEWIAQYLTLKHAALKPSLVRPGTIEAITSLKNEGILTLEDASTLMRGYRILRKVVGNLRLMNSQDRYALPDDDRQMEKLAYLMGEPNPESVRQMCQAVRTNNRVIFDRLISD